MRKLFRIVGLVLAAVILLAATGIGAAWVMAGRRMNREYPAPPAAQLSILRDSAAIARGQHLVMAVAQCAECHGDDMGGKLLMDAGPLGIVYTSNLTRGQGGIGGSYQVQDWVNAIRHGLKPDRASLLIMPSEAYAHLSDSDLASMIAYLEQVPPVDRVHGESEVRLVGRVLLSLNQLPLLTAENMAGNVERNAVQPGVSLEYGRYLATVGGCNGCHLPDLTGGLVTGPPGSPPSANLTPAGIGDWTEPDFFRAMRDGRRPDGSAIHPVMPWRYSGRMTDDELRAIWLYLESMPPKATPADS